MRFHICITYLLCLLHGQTALAASFTPTDDVIGAVEHYTVKEQDNLYEVARRHDIGIVELLSANPGVDVWQPAPGTRLTITSMHVLPPAPHDGIVINLSELRLFYYTANGEVMTFPIGIGREGWETPTGKTSIASKRRNPTWTPPDSIREENPDLPEFVPIGPDNPLGAYAMNTGWSNYVIHGTNRPYGVGKRSSHGCIRLYPEDIETLFHAVSVGTPVTVIDTPYKLGWRGDDLFLEVTPTQDQADVIAAYKEPVPISIPEIYDSIRQMTEENVAVRWYEVEEAIARRSGIPMIIGKRVEDTPKNLFEPIPER
jgi:L,D-transpeptidase ErfK/SrfK